VSGKPSVTPVREELPTIQNLFFRFHKAVYSPEIGNSQTWDKDAG